MLYYLSIHFGSLLPLVTVSGRNACPCSPHFPVFSPLAFDYVLWAMEREQMWPQQRPLTVLASVLWFALLFSAIHPKEDTSLSSQRPQTRSTGEKASNQPAVWSPRNPAELVPRQPSDP